MTKPGDKDVALEVLDPSGNPLNPSGSFTLEDGTEVNYSDKSNVSYENIELDFISIIEVNRKEIKKGKYTINVYVDGIKTGSSTFILK